MNCSTPGLPVHHQLPGFTQTHVHWVGDAIQPSHPLSSPFPPASESFPMSQLFTWGGQSTGVSALGSFLPKNTQGWSSFRMDWLDLLAVQGTLKSLLQNHSSKASILQCSAFFMVQFSHPYVTTGKTTALTRQNLISAHQWFSVEWSNSFLCPSVSLGLLPRNYFSLLCLLFKLFHVITL